MIRLCRFFRFLSPSTLLALTVASVGCDYHTAIGEDGFDAGRIGRDAAADLPDAYRMERTVGYVSGRIDPGDATISCTGSQMFAFYARGADGTEVLERPMWTLQYGGLGTVSDAGLFRPLPGCLATGRTQVIAQMPDGLGGMLLATANITVRNEVDPILVDVPTLDEATTAFANPTSTTSPSPIVYPLDGVIMPNNVAPPDIQWTGGVAGDTYRVTIQSASLVVTAYVRHTGAAFEYDWVPAADVWDLVAGNYDAGLAVQVDRFDAASSTVMLGTPISMRITRSGVYGQVYYSSLPTHVDGVHFGEIDRIYVSTGHRENLIPHPPQTATITQRCVQCHGVSRDGRYMAAMVGDGGQPATSAGTVFDLTDDLTVDPAPSLFPLDTGRRPLPYYFGGATFSPDDSRLFFATANAILIDPLNGMSIGAAGLPPADTAHYYYTSDWAPDNSAIALGHMDPATTIWLHVATHVDLSLLPVTGPDSFGTEQVIHHADDLMGSPEGGRVDVHPSWSPDSRYIAFQHGTWTTTANGTSSVFDSFSSAALYLITPDGRALQRLDTATAGAHGYEDYWPTFAPFQSVEPDGKLYFWLSFTSGRAYGNAQAGTSGIRQLWVSAIEMPTGEFPPVISADPSAVPFWLPGQDLSVENFAQYWAALACRAQGADCASSSQCCSGYCTGTAGSRTCGTPPADQCHREGESCGTDADCCDTGHDFCNDANTCESVN